MNAQQQLILFVFLGMLTLCTLFVFASFLLLVRPWLQAFMNGTPVSLVQILAMRLRGNPPTLLLDAYIRLKHAGAAVTIAEVERTYIEVKNRVFTSDDLVDAVKSTERSR